MNASAWRDRDAPLAVPRLDRDACHVWWARPGWVRPELLTLLDGAESGRRRRYQRVADRDRFTTGVVVTRLVLGALLGQPAGRVRLDRACATCGAPHGPPRLAGRRPPFQISVAHARDRVAVAVSRAPGVGVDVEWAAPDLDVDGVQEQVLAGEEAAALASLDPAARAGGFLTYWTRKEAVLKATGDGLTADPRRVTVTPPASPPRLLRWPDRPDLPGRTTLVTLRPGPGYAACLALVDQPAVTVRERSAASVLRR